MTPSPGCSQLLAHALATSTFDRLTPQALDDTKRAVLDWLGSALAGSIERPARIAQQVAATLGTSDEATIFSAGRASAASAALANGVSSHILEFDDIHKTSTVHAAAPVISAALAVAEREHASGPAFLLAVALGYEAALRVGDAVNPSHYRYWHPTGTAATFGSAAAAGSLLRLNPKQMLDALGSAGTQAAGLWEFNADGAMSKHLHPGKAAFNGIFAADLANAGFTGASRILEGDRGFFRAMSETFDESRIADRLGSHWKITENCYKLYSCCAHTHTSIDAAIDLRSKHNVLLDAIEAIEVRLYGPGYEIVKEQNPCTPYQAKFSVAYCVAAALLEGAVGLEQFAPDRFSSTGVLDERTRDVLHKTVVLVDPTLTAMYPAAWPGRVTLLLKNGETRSAGGDYPRGNPENPVSTAGLEDKFRALVTPRLGDAVTAAALNALNTIESCPDMSRLFRGFSKKTPVAPPRRLLFENK